MTGSLGRVRKAGRLDFSDAARKEGAALYRDKVDLLIRNSRVYNSYFKKFVDADVWILNGRIFYVDERKTGSCDASEVLDASGLYMVPGLVDIHMHIESSMMTPAAFCGRLVGCGVTTVVSEPHEMANVNGINGILDMIRAGENSPVDIFYGIPSCVPSTSPDLETTGGLIRCGDMERLKENRSVVCVGEVMNYRQIIRENHLEISKFLRKLRARDPIFPIEGHCPSLVGPDLAKFLYLGINGDHTEHTIEELRQRFAGGMFVEIQEKMLRREVLEFIAEHNLFEHFCFVTDDVMADTFYYKGHLDALVRRAIALGMAPEQAVYNATYTGARRMNLLDRGTLAPGKLADFLLLDDLEKFSVAATYKRGICVYRKGSPLPPAKASPGFPEAYYHSVRLAPQGEERLRIPVDAPAGSVPVRVIGIHDGSTRTTQEVREMPVKDGLLQWEGSGCLLAAVFERYGKNGNVGYGLLTGDCHKRGAVATSYAHDCHNVLVAGADVPDMLLALNRLIRLQGGIVVTDGGTVQAELRLNIGGILSDSPAGEVGAALARVREAMTRQGYRHSNPVMSFCTVTLPVSPALKLTDKGLIDVGSSRIVPLVLRDNPGGHS